MPKARYYLLLFICLIIVAASVRSIGNYYKAGDRLTAAQEELERVQAENARLKREKLKVDSPEFVEEEARDRLGMSRPGETVIILPEELRQPLPGVPKEDKPNWKKWWELLK